jgi:ADP-glucose pyrophosphorylase
MNTIHSENEKNLTVAINYYNAMLNKNFETMESYLHENVHFISPLAEMKGKEKVAHAAKNFDEILQNIHIRSQFTSNNQIMLACDMIAPSPIGKFRAAVLMDFKNGQISKIELFYDGRPFIKKIIS